MDEQGDDIRRLRNLGGVINLLLPGGDGDDKEKLDSLTTLHHYMTAATMVSCDLREKKKKR